MIYNNLKSNFK
jgi:glutamine synthetase